MLRFIAAVLALAAAPAGAAAQDAAEAPELYDAGAMPAEWIPVQRPEGDPRATWATIFAGEPGFEPNCNITAWPAASYDAQGFADFLTGLEGGDLNFWLSQDGLAPYGVAPFEAVEVDGGPAARTAFRVREGDRVLAVLNLQMHRRGHVVTTMCAALEADYEEALPLFHGFVDAVEYLQ